MPGFYEGRVVLILGAGATVADARRLPIIRRPPLDRRFFHTARRLFPKQVEAIARYFLENYARDICAPDEDSLEQVMATLYSDVHNPDLRGDAYECFLALVGVFSRWLSQTTNKLQPTQKSLLYRVIASYFRAGVVPSALTIVTFNQDIQIEQALFELSQKQRFARLGTMFAFPGLYHIGVPRSRITGNPRFPLFPLAAAPDDGVEVLKLHGSLNWYSTHRSRNPSIKALFNPQRPMRVTRRRTLNPTMGMRTGQRGMLQTFPLVVPPVTHKSGILHDDLRPLWALAQERLEEATHLMVFGYSCPIGDFESADMIRRALNANRQCKEISIIDPDSNVLNRYIQLTGLNRIYYYRYASDFLSATAAVGPLA